MSRKPTLKEWIFATRPWSFPASGLPAVTAIFYIFCFRHNYNADINWWLGVLAVLGTIFMHAGGNLISDYFDYIKGVDREDRMSNSLLLDDGVFSPKQILNYGLICLLTGALIGFYLYSKTGWVLLILGGFGILSALLYFQFKARALGDLLIFVTYAPVIMLGVGYVLTMTISIPLLLLSIPIGLIIVNILHANNTRDIETDSRAGIRTLAMNLGVRRSVVLYDVFTVSAYLLIVLFVAIKLLPLLSLAVIVTFPLAWRNMKMMETVKIKGREAIKTLDEKTAQLQLILCSCLSLTLFIANWV
ncbi:MAG: 1,4-dihydroxy-2-naphthoate octaprenyltransferase [Bacteroidales bacterium]|nr:1,4-dihydroxy-2-naphthoate octaprenyltransferase [Bacteroidales bacterium]